MYKSNSLKHFGILGMKWGRRKDSRPNSPEHELVSKSLKKKIKDISDDDIKEVVKRIKLVNEAKKSGALRGKNIKKMSNDDISAAMNRKQLTKEDWLYGVRKTKKIKDMSDTEVKKILDRHLLEKSYKEVALNDYGLTARLVKVLINIR